MNTPADELATVRDLLNRLETGELTLRHGDQDVSRREIDVLKREVARLEKILKRVKSEGTSDKPINYSGRTKRFSRRDK
jgi:ribosomal protein S2